MTDDTKAEETPAAEPSKDADGASVEGSADEAPKPKKAAAKKPAAKKDDSAGAGDKPKAKKPAAKKEPAKKDDASADDAKAKKPAAKKEPAKKAAAPAKPTVVRAHAKYVRTSARKARLVCDNIRGKSVEDARAILLHTPRAAAENWSKLLESAVANAENNHELDGDDLRILAIHADEGPTLKRFRPRAQGRASAIRKRTAHLSIALGPKEQ